MHHSVVTTSSVRAQSHGVSEHSDSSASHDNTTISHNNQRINNEQESSPAGFQVYSGYEVNHNPTRFIKAISMGDGSHSKETHHSGTVITSRLATPSGAEDSSSAIAWTTPTSEKKKKKKKAMEKSSTSRIAVWVPREVAGCGRVHDLGTEKGWNLSIMPVYRSPASACNRLFSAIKETRPGGEPKELLARLAYTPQSSPARNHQQAHFMLISMPKWDPSTILEFSTQSQKPLLISHTSSKDKDTALARRQLLHQNFTHDSPPSKKVRTK